MIYATFFGHRDLDYSPYRQRIRAIVTDLIEDRGVEAFLSGFRGNFDRLCTETVFDLKSRYPAVKNIMVLSYHDPHDFVLPKFFDESIYLLEKRVPPKFAISYTNREMILKADFIISGVCSHFGGAYTACKFARQKKKTILDIFEDH